MTNDDLRNIEFGLLQLKRMSLRPVMNFMVTFAMNTIKPAASALTSTQNDIRKEYLDLDPEGLDQRNEADNSLKLLSGKSLEEYNQALEDLFTRVVEPPLPKFKFRVTDFLESNVAASPELLERLGPLVDFTDFEDFVTNFQKATSLPTKGFTPHKLSP